MKYKEFSKKLIGDILGTQISERSEFYRNVISLSEDGKIYMFTGKVVAMQCSKGDSLKLQIHGFSRGNLEEL